MNSTARSLSRAAFDRLRSAAMALRPGERVLVSAAAGATGILAVQIARLLGCEAWGIAGGAAKCAYLTEELGIAGAVDYKSGALAEQLDAAGGFDVYFDNVGGPLLDQVLRGMKAEAAGDGFSPVRVNLYAWEFRRHAIDDKQVYASHGFLSPRQEIATRLKLHSVEIAQGPVARLRGYATVHLGLAGGSFAMRGVPIEDARALRAQVMETITATDYSRLDAAPAPQALSAAQSGFSENFLAT